LPKKRVAEKPPTIRMLAASGNQERIASMPAIFGGSEGSRSLFAVLSRVDNELCTNAIDHSGRENALLLS